RAWTCRSTCAEPRSRNGSGGRFATSPRARRRAMPRSQTASGCPERRAPSPARARPIPWPSQFHATGWCVGTVRCRATAGAWSASASCCGASIARPREPPRRRRPGSPSLRVRPAREVLPDALDALPRVLAAAPELSRHVANREGVRPVQLTELAPRDGHRHRRSRPGAQRVAGDGGGAAAIAQVVDEDAPAALALRRDRHEAIGLGTGERLGESAGESLDQAPLAARIEWHDHMQSLAAGHSQEGLQLELAEPPANVPCGGLQLVER